MKCPNNDLVGVLQVLPPFSSSTQFAAIECSTNLVEPLHSPVVPVGHLVRSAPAPGREHRPVQGAALVNQAGVSSRIVLSHFFGRVGEVELDRPTAARGEVHEKRPSPRVEEVARMRLAVQQLLVGFLGADRRTQSTQRVTEEFPVRIGQLGGCSRSLTSLSAPATRSVKCGASRSIWRRAEWCRMSTSA